MRAIVRREEDFVLLSEVLSINLTTKLPPPPRGGDAKDDASRTCSWIYSLPRDQPPHLEMEKPWQRTGRRINTVTLEPVDDIWTAAGQFFLPGDARVVKSSKNHRERIFYEEAILFDHSTRSEADGIQWRGTFTCGIVSAPLNLFNSLRRDKRTRISSRLSISRQYIASNSVVLYLTDRFTARTSSLAIFNSHLIFLIECNRIQIFN